MSEQEVVQVYDGDTGRLEPELLDRGTAIDLTNCAVWFDVRDANVLPASLLARRPWKILPPKTDGKAELFLRGSETDNGGLGRDLMCTPVAMIPTHALDPTLRAANLLLNASLDTASGSPPNRIASSWTASGTLGSCSYDNHALGPKPATIFGTVQAVDQPTPGGSTSFLAQSVSIGGAPGDYYTLGVWIRANNLGGTAANNNNAIRLVFGNSADNVTLQLPNTDYDWTFYTLERKLTVAQTTVAVQLVNYGETGQWRYDEANFFAGRYRKVYLDRFRVRVARTRRIPKTANQLAGYGSLERDSNSDGLADGLVHGSTWSGVTPTLEKDPAHVFDRERSQKLVLVSTPAGVFLKHTARGRFLAGEQWTFSLRAKTSGAMSSAATLALQTEPFVNGGKFQAATPVNVGPNLSTFTLVSAVLTLTNPTDALECRIGLGGITSGTLWLDDLQLVRT